MQRGFTMIELVIVIAIIAIAASLAIPKINDWVADQDLNAASRELAADLRLLQQMSVNSGGGAIPIMYFKNASPYGYYTYLNGKVVKPSRDFPATVKFGGIPTNVTFGLSGAPVSSANMTITLTRTDGKGSKSVIIQAITGRVRIQ